MLNVDLGELARKRRLQLDESVPADSHLLADAGFRLAGPLDVHLEIQPAGNDVLVRGELEGAAEVACRRCLVDVRVPIDHPVTLLYREGVPQVEAEAEEIYTLPSKGNGLDLSAAIREHLLLAVPEFVECQEACRGLCPSCGSNLNESTCRCSGEVADDRWAKLREVDHG